MPENRAWWDAVARNIASRRSDADRLAREDWIDLVAGVLIRRGREPLAAVRDAQAILDALADKRDELAKEFA